MWWQCGVPCALQSGTVREHARGRELGVQCSLWSSSARARAIRWQRVHTRDANTHSSVSLNSGCSSLPDVLRVKRDTVLVAKSVNVEQIRNAVYTNIPAQD